MTLNRTRGDRPRQVIAHDRLRATRCSRRGQGGAGAATTRSAARTARTTAAPTGAGAFTRTASSAACGSRGDRSASRDAASASTRARSATAASRCASTSSATGSRSCTSTSTSCPAVRRPPRPRAPASSASAAGLPRRSARCRWTSPSATWSRSAPARAPARPDPPAHPPALPRPLLQPGELLLLLRADGEQLEASSPRSRTRRGASATPTCSQAGEPSRGDRQGVPRLAVHGHGPALPWRVAAPGETLVGPHREPRGRRKAFDATLTLRAPRAARAALARAARAPGGDAAVLGAIYGHAVAPEAQGRAVHPHPARDRAR